MPSEPSPSLFSLMGGEPALRAVIDDFIERVFADVMIGFFFAKADKARIKSKEYELAAALLGAEVSYSGRGLPEAHAAHPIMGGHFDRRSTLLKETLADHRVPGAVVEAWLEHSERMRGSITQQDKGQCDDPAPGRRLPLAFAAMVKNPDGSVGVGARGRRELPLVDASKSKRKP